MIRKRILLIGRNPIVLANLSAALTNEGFEVQTTGLVEQASKQFDAIDFDLIAFGRGIDEEMKALLKADFLTKKPTVHFIDGLAPVTSLLVKQIKQTLANTTAFNKTLIRFVRQPADDLLIDVTVTVACQLSITLYQLDAVHHTEQKTLASEFVIAGNHTFRIANLPSVQSTINFLVAETDKQDLLVMPLR
ncbi:hypothetical protein GCM10028818_46240 [Spirosoma horti]